MIRIPLFFAIFTFLAAPAHADNAAALIAINRAYAENWKKGDADALMALFTPDVTAVPHHGDTPIKGRDALRAYWFPKNGPRTIVPEYKLTPEEIIVQGDTGVVRGRFRLVFEYDGTRTTIPDGNYVHIYQRTNHGWKMRLLTWNDDPRDWTQKPAE